MKKSILFYLFAFAAIAIQAQSVSYEIDPIRPDSFYLVEHSIGAITVEQPRPQEVKGYTLFHSVKELSVFTEKIRAKAAKDEEEAQKQFAQAKQMEAISGKIEEAAVRKKVFFETPKK